MTSEVDITPLNTANKMKGDAMCDKAPAAKDWPRTCPEYCSAFYIPHTYLSN
jgi:hypothetical protein